MVGRFSGISFTVRDIEAVYNALELKGVHFLAPPEKQSWGGYLAHFQDPDGNTLTLAGR
jgi:predicted enzyme related to lactoylglutathione lyase